MKIDLQSFKEDAVALGLWGGKLWGKQIWAQLTLHQVRPRNQRNTNQHIWEQNIFSFQYQSLNPYLCGVLKLLQKSQLNVRDEI